MVEQSMKLLMGEKLYKLDAKEIYNNSLIYADKFIKNSEDRSSGEIYLYCIYSAFMEGYITKKICRDIGIMVSRGFCIPGHTLKESIDISAAILQYGVEKLNCGECAERIYWMYRDGTRGSIKEDKNLAWEWLNRSAQMGCSNAQLTLGYIYHNDMYKIYDAEEWWLAAAKQGNVAAMYNLGVVYGGTGFWDYPKAGYWLEQAAKRGDKKAEKILNSEYVYDRKYQRWYKRG